MRQVRCQSLHYNADAKAAQVCSGTAVMQYIQYKVTASTPNKLNLGCALNRFATTACITMHCEKRPRALNR
jgi:hypothetical protein